MTASRLPRTATARMDEKNNPPTGYRTAWHPLLVFALAYFAPANRKLTAEHQLNHLPQRVDIVVIEMADVPAEPVDRFHSVFDYTRKYTLIEYKGVTDDLESADVFVLLGYACQYVVMNGITNLDDVCLMFVAERITQSVVDRITSLGGTFTAVENGLWRGNLAGFPLHGVELRDAYQAGSSERLLGLFTRAFVQNPIDNWFTDGLDENELDLYDRLCQHIQQLRRDPATMHMKDIDTAEKSLVERLPRFIANAPVEVRLAGLTPEQILAKLTPEERIAGLTLEQRIAGLTPEQLAAALPPDVLEFLAQKAKSR